MNNTAQKVTRIDKDAWDIATELANEYGDLSATSSAKVFDIVQKTLSLKKLTL